MKYKIHILSEIFVVLSILYLVFFEYDEGFNQLIIFLGSIIFMFEILRISIGTHFIMYRSRNIQKAIVESVKYIIKNISIFYLVFVTFIAFNCLGNIDDKVIVSLVVSLVSLILLISLIISVLSAYFVSESVIALLMILLLSISYTLILAYGKTSGVVISFLTLYNYSDIIYSFVKLFIILVILFAINIMGRKSDANV